VTSGRSDGTILENSNSSAFSLDIFAPAATNRVTMVNHEPTDAELVANVLSGDREAFGCLYDRYARLVRSVVWGVAGDSSAAADLTQECFLRAHKNLHRLKKPDRFGSWLFGMARQVARERKRSLRRDRHRFVGDIPLEIASESDAAVARETAEETVLVMQRLAELPERERLAIHAFFLQERDAKQAAELLNLSPSGFYALLERGLRRLQALIHRPTATKEAD
jgi:RNA polymerase sigma-70 factor, ECF subfamily